MLIKSDSMYHIFSQRIFSFNPPNNSMSKVHLFPHFIKKTEAQKGKYLAQGKRIRNGGVEI